MKVKLIIATVGILGYFSYLKLSKYLKDSKVETANFLRSENGESFFLNIDISENPLLNIPMLKWSIDKIKLVVNGEPIATSLPVTSKENNFTQEFKAVQTANFESLNAGDIMQKSIVEVTYKTIAGLKITHQYEVNLGPEETSPFNATKTATNSNTTTKQQQAQTCECEII